jgi:hypothetical protein
MHQWILLWGPIKGRVLSVPASEASSLVEVAVLRPWLFMGYRGIGMPEGHNQASGTGSHPKVECHFEANCLI